MLYANCKSRLTNMDTYFKFLIYIIAQIEQRNKKVQYKNM